MVCIAPVQASISTHLSRDLIAKLMPYVLPF